MLGINVAGLVLAIHQTPLAAEEERQLRAEAGKKRQDDWARTQTNGQRCSRTTWYSQDINPGRQNKTHSAGMKTAWLTSIWSPTGCVSSGRTFCFARRSSLEPRGASGVELATVPSDWGPSRLISLRQFR